MRVFLPDFWMVLMKPIHPAPANEVHFMVPIRMTKWDVRNYLENIYKIPVVAVQTIAKCGKIYRHPAEEQVIKDQDWRLAIVTLPKGEKFEFPNLFENTKMDQEFKEFKYNQKRMEKMRYDLFKKQPATSSREDVPSWF